MDENEIIRQAMSIIGKRTSPKKKKSSAANGATGGRPRGTFKPLAEFECKCGATSDDAHKTYCPRGRAYRRRHEQTEATK
jgi:hypothetical protein